MVVGDHSSALEHRRAYQAPDKFTAQSHHLQRAYFRREIFCLSMAMLLRRLHLSFDTKIV